MKKSHATALFSDAIALAAEGDKAPTRIMIMPAGPHLEAVDGRKWKLLDPKAVIAASSTHVEKMIDWEHASFHKAPKGEEAKASGWVKNFFVGSEGAIWGDVEWTSKAEEAITSKEYRFISPEFVYDDNGVVLSIEAVALVNRPAFDMPALASAQQEKTDMDLSKICELLGIPSDSDVTAICSAIEKQQSDQQTALASAKTDMLNDYVPKATHTALASERDELKTELDAIKKDKAETAIASALDKAVEDGKILQCSRDQYYAMCSAEGGLEKFQKLVETLPVIMDGKSQIDPNDDPVKDADKSDPHALAAAARKYVEDQASIGNTVSLAAAMERIDS